MEAYSLWMPCRVEGAYLRHYHLVQAYVFLASLVRTIVSILLTVVLPALSRNRQSKDVK